MFSRALNECPVSANSMDGQPEVAVSQSGDKYYITMYYKPIAEAFLQLSEDGQSDFFVHLREKLKEYATKPEPGEIARSYDKAIDDIAYNLYPEAKAFIEDLFMAMPMDEEIDLSVWSEETQKSIRRTLVSARRLKESMRPKK